VNVRCFIARGRLMPWVVFAICSNQRLLLQISKFLVERSPPGYTNLTSATKALTRIKAELLKHVNVHTETLAKFSKVASQVSKNVGASGMQLLLLRHCRLECRIGISERSGEALRCITNLTLAALVLPSFSQHPCNSSDET
jgi:hypothetical protein